jgi:protein phosphatase
VRRTIFILRRTPRPDPKLEFVPMIALARSHQGLKRRHNEDRHLIIDLGQDAALLAVADGMGGEAAGDLAATMAVDYLAERSWNGEPDPAILDSCFRTACSRIHAHALANPETAGMGTTLTAIWYRAGRGAWAHVGDSRLYLWRDRKLIRITQDHTAVEAMVQRGALTSDEAASHPARNMLLDCVGCGACSPDSGTFEIRPHDLILLTTDGLHDQVPAETMTQVLGRTDELDNRLSALVKAALEAGGPDNITVVGLELSADPPVNAD